MQYEAFKFRSIIFWDKSRIIKHHISVISDNDIYDFIIDAAGHNAVDIVGFFKYREIINSNASIQRQLHEAISSRIINPRVLKDMAFENRFDIYGSKVYLRVDGYTYAFKIDGIGPQAIKISTQITYDEITTSDDEIESILRGVIMDKYVSKFNDAAFIRKVDAEWEENEAHKNAVMDEVKKEEEIRRRKQEELERFLKS
jgi:hypothetical protein